MRILQPEDLGKILLAMLLGGLLGAEREFHDKAAGFRTLILISVGACLFTLWSMHLGDPDDRRASPPTSSPASASSAPESSCARAGASQA